MTVKKMKKNAKRGVGYKATESTDDKLWKSSPKVTDDNQYM